MAYTRGPFSEPRACRQQCLGVGRPCECSRARGSQIVQRVQAGVAAEGGLHQGPGQAVELWSLCEPVWDPPPLSGFS